MNVIRFRKGSKASSRTRLQARKRPRQSRVRVNMMSMTCGRRAAFGDLICRTGTGLVKIRSGRTCSYTFIRMSRGTLSRM